MTHPRVATAMVLIVLACNRRRVMAALSDNDRAFTERWMHGESYTLRRGVPLVVLTDEEETVATTGHHIRRPTMCSGATDAFWPKANSMTTDPFGRPLRSEVATPRPPNSTAPPAG